MPAESEKSLRFNAENRVPTGLVFHPVETIREKFDGYRQYVEEDYGWTPGDKHFSVLRVIYVADTMEKAREEAEPRLRKFYQTLTAGNHIGVAAGMVGDEPYDLDRWDESVENLHPHGEFAYNYGFDEFQEYGETIVGTPEYVTVQIKKQFEGVGGMGRLVGLSSTVICRTGRSKRISSCMPTRSSPKSTNSVT